MALSELEQKFPRESQQNSAFVPRDEVEHIFDKIAEYIVSATKKNCPHTGDSVIAKGEYRLTLDDLRGLSYCIRDLTDKLFQSKKNGATPMRHRGPTPAVFDPPRAMQPMGSTPAGPITTLNASPADGPIRFPGFPRQRRRLPGPNKATLVAADNVAEITWFGPMSGEPSPDESEAEASPQPSAETPEMPSIVITGPSDEDIGGPGGSRQEPTPSCGLKGKGQGSVHIPPSVDEQEGEGPEAQAQAEPPTDQPQTVLGRIRRTSAGLQLGRTVGSLVNGAYRNSDYKPRRDSSATRMRAILDRLSPPLPSTQENADVFSAMTGARPVTPDDVSRAKRPEQSRPA